MLYIALIYSNTEEVRFWHLLGFNQVYQGLYNNVVSIVLPFAFTYYVDQYNTIRINYSRWKVPSIAQGDVNVPVNNSDGGDSVRKYRNLKLITGCDSLMEQLNAKIPIIVLRECIQKCIDNRLVQNDIQWRHVGLFPVPREGADGYELISNFIDLTGMRQVESKAEAEECMKTEFEVLVNEPWNV